MNTALHGIRLIDMSRVFAAPVGAQILGDLGADVIKVERSGTGDDGRGYGTAWITVNHSKPEGQEIIRALVKEAAVLIENFKVGDLVRFGLDYDSLRAINPRLI